MKDRKAIKYSKIVFIDYSENFNDFVKSKLNQPDFNELGLMKFNNKKIYYGIHNKTNKKKASETDIIKCYSY